MKTTELSVTYLSPNVKPLESLYSTIICQSPKPGENESIEYEDWTKSL